MYINLNRGFVSTQIYTQYKDSFHYDSFLFGSSRSGFFRIDDWLKHIPDSSSCFHFDGYGESLYLIHKKILYIDGRSKINNAIICIDRDVLMQAEPYYSHLHYTPPKLVDNDNYLSFQFEYIKTYLQPEFFRAFAGFKLTNKIKPYMVETGIIDTMPYHYDLKHNEVGRQRSSDIIDTSYYTEKVVAAFAKVNRTKEQTYFDNSIKEKQRLLLTDIKNVLDKNNTSYRVVINPMYDQKKLSVEDMTFLKSLFKDNLYDFSGINKFTDSYYNYTDPSHFRAFVASKIMEIMYEKDEIRQNAMIDSLKVY